VNQPDKCISLCQQQIEALSLVGSWRIEGAFWFFPEAEVKVTEVVLGVW
jgi:hypothetical protein